MKARPATIIVALILFVLAPGHAQESGAGAPADSASGPGNSASGPADGASAEPPAGAAPEGFAEIQLGLPRDSVQDLLRNSGYFRYRGDPDVSLLPTANRSVIETEGRTFVDRAFFQFSDNDLYIIILQLNRTRMDHYTVYRTLAERYGEASSVGPREITWEWDTVLLSLERPLTVKYVDRPVFEALREEAQVERSMREVTRDAFLGEL